MCGEDQRTSSKRIRLCTVHPRVCGEDIQFDFRSPCVGSPRVCKTQVSSEDRLYRSVHPRVCGEDLAESLCYVGNGGSPPRVRGRPISAASDDFLRSGSPPRVRGRQRPPGRVHDRHNRFTPACAGKTLQYSFKSLCYWFTPACAGKTSYSWVCLLPSIGSPPRVRGRLIILSTSFSALLVKIRFTPACAGRRQFTLF